MMKTIGILGGMSPESTVLYYQQINREINRRLGGHHSAKIVMYSGDFEQMVQLQHQNDWQGAGRLLAAWAQQLESIGADGLLLATNTMHKVAAEIENTVKIPLLHVVDAIAEAIHAQGLQRVGLLGTRFTMSETFYTQRLSEQGIETLLPSEGEQNEVHRIIFEELCANRIERASKRYYQQLMAKLQQQGAEGIILGCTEIGLLIQQHESPIPLFDSTEIHALAAVDFMLAS